MNTDSVKPRFMTSPAQLESLEGQRYVVLRPMGTVSEVYKSIQGQIKARFAAEDLTYPNTEHIMLGGFPGGETKKLIDIVSTEAVKHAGIAVQISKLTIFPAPFKVVLFEIQKTNQLIELYENITQESKAAGIPQFDPERSSSEWTFHMSVAYGKRLDDAKWNEVVSYIQTLPATTALCEVNEIEVVEYSDLQENSVPIKTDRIKA